MSCQVSACVLSAAQAAILATLTSSVTFKLKDGSTAAGPYACRSAKSRWAAVEQPAGGKTVAIELYDLFLPAGTLVQPFWRADVTYADGSVISYFVRDAGSPTTDEVLRRVVIERVR